ncbi:MAG: 5'-methylthioadenosine/S-adenosylhomocysteine nucleosidase [bacterium]|nr:5'-methylthioadenosine/S-adenosylhomocysteine nucleosidase [bacterium]
MAAEISDNMSFNGPGKTGILMATYLEAAPFVSGLSLTRIEEKPFPVYEGSGEYLILSGIGKANAAMAASYLIYKHNTRVVVNIGAAGSTGSAAYEVGDILHINRVVEYDRPQLIRKGERVLVPDLINDFINQPDSCSPGASLATQDIPVLNEAFRKEVSKSAELVDMEGASFVQACRLFSAKAYLFKIVTDTPGHDKDADIIENIKLTRDKLYRFYAENVQEKLTPPE